MEFSFNWKMKILTIALIISVFVLSLHCVGKTFSCGEGCQPCGKTTERMKIFGNNEFLRGRIGSLVWKKNKSWSLVLNVYTCNVPFSQGWKASEGALV